MTGDSKFSGLKAMRAQRQAEAEAALPVDQVVEEASEAHPPPAPAKRKVGRPPGKRSNPDYQQVTILLHSETYQEVRQRLFVQKKEVSMLLNELLEEWLHR